MPLLARGQMMLALLACQSASAQAALLWPLPSSNTFGSGVSVLAGSANASFFGAAPSALLERAFERYAKLLPPSCDGPPGVATISGFELRVDDPEAPGPAEFMDESYELVLPSRGPVLASAATQWGALRALETFSQLATDCTLHGTPVRVADKPRFTHRGIMLDLARRFWPADALFDVLDAMAHSKLNVLHLHLTDGESFMFESTTYPQLNRAAYHQPSCTGPYGSAGGEPCLYRQSVLRQLVAAATDRGIRVVPEFDMPGHAGGWGVAFPEIIVNSTCTAGFINSSWVLLNPFEDATWRVITAVLAEAAAIFPDARIHLGGDEVCWRSYNQSAAVRAAILGAGRALDDDGFKWVVRSFLARAQQIVASLGRNSSVWNEAFGIYGPGNHGFVLGNSTWSSPDSRAYSINTELAPATAVYHWYGGTGSWYNAFTGRVDSANATAVLAHGQMYIATEGWYLPIGAKDVKTFDWTTMYAVDPATNKTCSYPLDGKGRPATVCTCFEQGAPGNLSLHAGPSAGGCYDIAPNAATGEYEQLLGGEACLWGCGTRKFVQNPLGVGSIVCHQVASVPAPREFSSISEHKTMKSRIFQDRPAACRNIELKQALFLSLAW